MKRGKKKKCTPQETATGTQPLTVSTSEAKYPEYKKRFWFSFWYRNAIISSCWRSAIHVQRKFKKVQSYHKLHNAHLV